jgi:predicted dehydrogenase
LLLKILRDYDILSSRGEKMINIAVIGLGNRGNNYMTIVKHFCKDEAKIVALCDKFAERLEECRVKFEVPGENCFMDENEFFKTKLADAIFICTQDRDHYGHAVKAIELGYDIMCEKPLSPSVSECEDLIKRCEKKGVRMLVCHVLRYSKYYSKLKELIDSGVIGEVVAIDHTENIGYYHFAHSYVRGNWRQSETTSPMIMAKTCHDFDIIHWLMDGGCERVSSFGSLKHFKPENAPEGAAKRCLDGCKAKKTCPFDCERLYITDPIWRATFLRLSGRIITGKAGSKKADKYKALKENNYGRCVYFSDNNVADHQMVNMDFSNGRTASLTVSAFSKRNYRHTHIMGTLGEIRGEDYTGNIIVRQYYGKKMKIATKLLPYQGHIGGDYGLVKDFVAMMNNKPTKQKDLTVVGVTIHSHKMALAAEHSRLNNGALIELEGFKN